MLSGTACESYRYLDVVTSVTEAAGEADDDFLKAAEVARRDGLQNSHAGARRVDLPEGVEASWRPLNGSPLLSDMRCLH